MVCLNLANRIIGFFNFFFTYYRIFSPSFATLDTCYFIKAVYFSSIQVIFFSSCCFSMPPPPHDNSINNGSLHRFFILKPEVFVNCTRNSSQLFRPFSPVAILLGHCLISSHHASDQHFFPLGLSYILYPNGNSQMV